METGLWERRLLGRRSIIEVAGGDGGVMRRLSKAYLGSPGEGMEGKDGGTL